MKDCPLGMPRWLQTLVTAVVVGTVIVTTLVLYEYRWRSLPLDVPGVDAEIVYARKPMFNLWVGTEQWRRLKVGNRTIDLPPQMASRDPVDVYLKQTATDTTLYFSGGGEGSVVDLHSLSKRTRNDVPDSAHVFLGAFVSPGYDLRFVPASEAPPTDRRYLSQPHL